MVEWREKARAEGRCGATHHGWWTRKTNVKTNVVADEETCWCEWSFCLPAPRPGSGRGQKWPGICRRGLVEMTEFFGLWTRPVFCAAFPRIGP